MPDFKLITRAQAIEAGKLVDVSTLAKMAGVRFPVALTRMLHDQYVTPVPEIIHQDETDRLWDVLTRLKVAIKGGGNMQTFTVSFQMYRDGKVKIEDVQLKSVIGPGDDAAPVITVMLPGED